MYCSNFNAGWTVAKADGGMSLGGAPAPEKKVHLPYDAMVHELRCEQSVNASHGGYYPGGNYIYKKVFDRAEVPGDCVQVEFEGVYRNAMVYLNGDFVGQHPYGYSDFYVDITRYLKEGKNELKVLVRNADGPNSRWYAGSGIYRDVKLWTGGSRRILPCGVFVSTPSVKHDSAVVQVKTRVFAEKAADLRLKAVLTAPDGSVAGTAETPVTLAAGETLEPKLTMTVSSPQRWSLETPALYRCKVTLLEDGTPIDGQETTFGIRTIRFDTVQGFTLNGKPLKIRGSCIHHDNGPVGAAAFARAEERRVEKMKEAGFNAIRSAHNPVSKAMLDACDRLGMLMFDESFDMWTVSKTAFDYSSYYTEWWQRDVQSMVEKDYNHPSVIFYSIGNEIPEVCSKEGARLARKQADFIRSLDDSRAITSAINPMFALNFEQVMAEYAADAAATTDVNDVMMSLGEQMSRVVTGESVGKTMEEFCGTLDVCGYNYAEARYDMDCEQLPNRLICGTESFPKEIDRIWTIVKRQPKILGDFTWTGWDYIGEAGIGKQDFDNVTDAMFGAWPWYLGYCGDIDICGQRRPQSYYREIVWGLRKDPYLAVGTPQHFHIQPKVSDWSWPEVFHRWTFEEVGSMVEVDVYADAQEVELFLNGVSQGKAPAGEEHRFMAHFEIPYQPGVLEAVSYQDGEVIGRDRLETAKGTASLRVAADRTKLAATGEDLSYLLIEKVDENGVVNPLDPAKVAVTVEGAGTLEALASADPVSSENFFDPARTPFGGQVLAIVRSGETAGAITVKVTDGTHETVVALSAE